MSQRQFSPPKQKGSRYWRWFGLYWLADSWLLPIVLFYGLWYGQTTLSKYIITAIIASFWGWSNYTLWTLRLWWLLRTPNYYGPLGTRSRWFLDATMYISSIAIGLAALELVIGTSYTNPKVRLLAMPGPTMLYSLAGCILVLSIGDALGIRAPVRISSVGRGMRMRSAMFTLVEDFGAVDVRAGQAWREEVMKRYDTDYRYQELLRRLSWIWVASCFIVAIILTIVVAKTNAEVGFGIAWGVSIPFLGVLMFATARAVKSHQPRGWYGQDGDGMALRA